MGKRTRKGKANATATANATTRAPAPPTPPPPPAAPPPAGRSWWFDFEIDRAHLALVRVAFFGILALDAFLQVAHAPRYGAAEFNVPHLAWLPLPSLGRDGMLAVDLALAYVCALAALGVATRVVVPVAAVLFNVAYFSSQLDSYQHHYLVGLLLVIASFVPWHAPPAQARVRSWALRLFMVQIAILYLWAAIAKLHPLWLDGTTLSQQLRPRWIRDLLGDQVADYRLASAAVVAGELFLALAWVWRRLWLPALAVGIAFHVGVELAEFKIGQFSYVMLAIYLLLVPERFAAAPGRALARVGAAIPGGAVAGAAVLLAALVGGALLFATVPLPASWLVLVASSALAIGAFAARRRWSVGAAHLAAWGMIAALARTTDQALDYHKFWAGSSRRLGKVDEMVRAYRGLLAIEPGHGPANYHLGRVAFGDGDLDLALDHFRRAQAGEPTAARAHLGEANVHAKRGDTAAARAALDRALAIEPDHRDARRMRTALDGGAPAAPTPSPDHAEQD